MRSGRSAFSVEIKAGILDESTSALRDCGVRRVTVAVISAGINQTIIEAELSLPWFGDRVRDKE